MTKSIAIVGGGIAGLSAGCYARMNGFSADIFELHDKPGGLCTSWEREGYTFAMVAMLAWQAKGDAGYPIGGSLSFARRIEKRFQDLGGQLHYDSRVARIVVEDDRAVGVELADGSVHRADVVVSAADGRSTLFDLLQGRFLDHALRERYGTLPRFPSLVRVSIGVRRDLRSEPHSINFPLESPILIDGAPVDRITARHYSYDPTMAPQGKAVVAVSLPASYEAWRTLHQHPHLYASEKNRIAHDVVQALNRRFPGFAEQVEVTDVATPLTYERYTANWNGAMEGWAITTRSLMMQMSSEIPGLDNFHMIGQWVQPGGGLPPAAMSGRKLIKRLCQKEEQAFQTSQPRT